MGVRALALFVMASSVAHVAAAQPIVYTVVHPPDVRAEGFYLLSQPARLYSIDVSTGQSTSITLQGSTCFAAAHPDGSRIYQACATLPQGATVSAVDPTTLNLIATTALPSTPRALRISPDGSTLVVTTFDSVLVLSAATLAVTGTVAINPVGPLVVAPDSSRAYVIAFGPPSIPFLVAAIDLVAARVAKQIALPSFASGIAISGDGRTVAVASFAAGGSLSVIDAQTDTLTATIDLRTSAAGVLVSDVAIDQSGARAYVPFLANSGPSSVLPFGTIDTPAQGATVSGLVTNFGWALATQPNAIPTDGSAIDVVIDNAIVGHPVYNNPRSDISTLFPGYVNSGGPVGYFIFDRRTLPDGVHTIAWVVRDSAGHATGIGSRYFTVQNR